MAPVDKKDEEIARLRERISLLEEELKQTVESMVPVKFEFPQEWKLSRTQTRIMRLLLSQEHTPLDRIIAYVYGRRDTRRYEAAKAHVCHLRKKMARWGCDLKYDYVAWAYKLVWKGGKCPKF